MQLYKDIWYPEKKIEVPNRNIVEILTSNERSSIRQGYYDEGWQRQQTRSFAINYGTRKGDRTSILRGFEFEGKLYEIDANGKMILVQPARGQLFYDEDKIEKNHFVFEGSLDEFVAEFVKSGYQIRDK